MRLAAGVLQADEHRGVQKAVGQRLPTAYLDARALFFGNQPVAGARIVEVLDNHARIKNCVLVIEHQHRNLAQRVVTDDFAVRRVRRVRDELAFHAFLDQNDAHLAGIGTGDRPDQLHHMDCFAKQIAVKNARGL